MMQNMLQSQQQQALAQQRYEEERLRRNEERERRDREREQDRKDFLMMMGLVLRNSVGPVESSNHIAHTNDVVRNGNDDNGKDDTRNQRTNFS